MPAHPPYAGIVTRLTAITLDAVPLSLTVAAIAAGIPAVWTQVIGTPPQWLDITVMCGATLLPLCYFTVSWASSGRTLGGLIMGLRLRRTDGRPVGPFRALLRAFLGLLLAPLFLVGMLLVLFTSRRQALHDLIFDTVVQFSVH